VNRVVLCGQSAGRTDSQPDMTNFCNFAKALKIDIYIYIYIYIYADILFFVDQASAVAIATRYGLGGPTIESQWGEIFAPVETDPRTHPASYTMGTESFPRVKRPRRGVDHPSYLAPKLKKEYSYTSTALMGPS